MSTESSSQSHYEPDELREAKLEKNSSTLFTTETRSTRRCTENPDASVKSPCPPCLRGETGRLAAARSLLLWHCIFLDVRVQHRLLRTDVVERFGKLEPVFSAQLRISLQH